MTLGSSSISRSSSETSSPLGLASSLTAHLQAASIQPSAPDCAVLPDSTLSRIGVPSLLPSLAEKGLATSFTERDSSGGVNDRGEVQLARPGESNIAEKRFCGVMVLVVWLNRVQLRGRIY